MQSGDLKRHALRLLKLSKKFLSEDGDLDPTAFILTADDQLLRPIELQNESSKLESCEKIIDEARRKQALAIITIFVALSKNFDGEEFDYEGYSWGDIQDNSSDRCILMTLSGPGITNWATALPFKTVNKRIVFGKRIEFTKSVEMGLFPGWSDQTSGSKPS